MTSIDRREAAFTPYNEIERLVCAGDQAGALAALTGMTEPQRGALLPRLAQLETMIDKARFAQFSELARNHPRHPTLQPWGEPVTHMHMDALAAVQFASGAFGRMFEGCLNNDTVVLLARQFRPPGLAAYTPQWPPERISARQRLYRAGLIPSPTGESFVLGLMQLPSGNGTRINTLHADTFDWRQHLDAMLRDDPGLAGKLLWMFEFEGDADVSLAHSDKYYSQPGRSWSDKLLDLCHQGVFTRGQLLDKALGALAHDWAQFRSGWHSRFHDALAPTAEEMRSHAGRYLALCHSRIPPTVGLALRALKSLASAGPLPAPELLHALAPVFSSGVKAQLGDALKLLDALVKHAPAQAHAAAELACHGLQFDDALLQGQIVQRLQRWGLDAGGLAALARVQPHVAARHRDAVMALLGTARQHNDRPATGAAQGRAAVPPETAMHPLDAARRLPSITALDELVEACARVLADDTDIDNFERVLQALVAGAPFPAAAQQAFGPVLKQARRARGPLAIELARLLRAAVSGPGRDALAAPSIDYRASVKQRLSDRISALVALAGTGARLSPLSCATHQGGAIDPAVLVTRAAALAQAGIAAPLADQRDALLRLVPTCDPTVLAAAEALPPSTLALALRYALGGGPAPLAEPQLAIAAARIRHVDGDDEALLAALGDVGPDGPKVARPAWQVQWEPNVVDGKNYPYFRFSIGGGKVPRETPADWWPITVHMPLGWESYRPWSVCGESAAEIAYFGSLQPSSLQSFFLEGVRLLANSLQWVEPAKHLKAYLAPLLDPTVTLGPMGHLLLAAALGEGEPTRATLAVDGLLLGHAQGRVQWPALAEPLARLVSQGVVTPARLRRNLLAASHRDRAAQHCVFELLCSLCEAPGVEPAPKGYAGLLDMLQDLALDLQRPLPDATRTGLQGLVIGGSGDAARKRLLALPQ